MECAPCKQSLNWLVGVIIGVVVVVVGVVSFIVYRVRQRRQYQAIPSSTL